MLIHVEKMCGMFHRAHIIISLRSKFNLEMDRIPISLLLLRSTIWTSRGIYFMYSVRLKIKVALNVLDKFMVQLCSY